MLNNILDYIISFVTSGSLVATITVISKYFAEKQRYDLIKQKLTVMAWIKGQSATKGVKGVTFYCTPKFFRKLSYKAIKNFKDEVICIKITTVDEIEYAQKYLSDFIDLWILDNAKSALELYSVDHNKIMTKTSFNKNPTVILKKFKDYDKVDEAPESV